MKLLGYILIGYSIVLIIMAITLNLIVEYGPFAGFLFFAFSLFIVGIILIKLGKKNTDS
jgi:hypothetical protein